MDGGKGVFDSFRVEEAYNWRDDIMEITRRIVYETDEARLNNIAEHFEVDLSEIREFLESKQKRMGNPMSNADRIRAMSDEELAEWVLQLTDCVRCYAWTKPESWKEWDSRPCYTGEKPCKQMWIDWLKQEVKEE